VHDIIATGQKDSYMKWLITGGCGFLGSNFIRYWLRHHPNDVIVNYDKLTYAGNLENLRDVEQNPRYQFVHGDIADKNLIEQWVSAVDGVVNFAAETHVDRSIQNPEVFIQTDVIGTYNILEICRRTGKRLIQISTDEVYGTCDAGSFSETASLSPGNPYSASKAGGDLLCMSYQKTYGMNLNIIRSCNGYGPFQYPEKLIPLFITHLLEKKKLPLYGDGSQVRQWIFAEDFCSALEIIIQKGASGEIYNITTGESCTNLEMTRRLLDLMGFEEDWIESVVDRPGHDKRYSMTGDKLQSLGWKPVYTLDKGLPYTVRWYREHPDWWKILKSGEYLEYYRRQYIERN